MSFVTLLGECCTLHHSYKIITVYIISFIAINFNITTNITILSVVCHKGRLRALQIYPPIYFAMDYNEGTFNSRRSDKSLKLKR